uniref:Macaca fascicularis brain cDNA clone: QccE-19756, similar to human neuronal pentraxin receptor (NPTXR), transcript variant2, mRNA, RefSeq: NM_058178.1 n=1 Tax=Macaca fascicularis TaxID=9541 RepID=I7GKD8_MACFA|nr:unnamed protein product [Macaca fascicularis]
MGLSCFRECVPSTMGQSFSPSLAQLEFRGELKKKRKLSISQESLAGNGRELALPPTPAWGQALNQVLPSCYLPDLPILWHVVPPPTSQGDDPLATTLHHLGPQIWAGRALRGGQSPHFTDEEAEARGGEQPSRSPSWTRET